MQATVVPATRSSGLLAHLDDDGDAAEGDGDGEPHAEAGAMRCEAELGPHLQLAVAARQPACVVAWWAGIRDCFPSGCTGSKRWGREPSLPALPTCVLRVGPCLYLFACYSPAGCLIGANDCACLRAPERPRNVTRVCDNGQVACVVADAPSTKRTSLSALKALGSTFLTSTVVSLASPVTTPLPCLPPARSARYCFRYRATACRTPLLYAVWPNRMAPAKKMRMSRCGTAPPCRTTSSYNCLALRLMFCSPGLHHGETPSRKLKRQLAIHCINIADTVRLPHAATPQAHKLTCYRSTHQGAASTSLSGL